MREPPKQIHTIVGLTQSEDIKKHLSCCTSIMATQYRVLEPFPRFVDSKGPSTSSYYYSSKMSLVSLFSSESSASRLRSRISVPEKVTNYLQLKNYQYEVTFGLYMMTPTEKWILNSIICTIMALLLYGILFGLQPLLIRTVCRMIWCMSGSYDGVEDICS